MVRLLVRAVGLVLLAAGFASLVIDGTRSIAAGKLTISPLRETVMWLFPTRFSQLQPAVERHLHPLLWDPVLLHLLMLPAWFCAGVLGLVLMHVARKPAPAIGFSGRP